MLSIEKAEELVDVEHVSFLETPLSERDAIFSKPHSDTSANSSQIDDLELFREFLTSDNENGYDKDDVNFTDSLIDGELCEYLGGKHANSNHGGRLVSDLELLDTRQRHLTNLRPGHTIKTHVLIPVKSLKNNTHEQFSSDNKDFEQDSQSMSKNAIAARENRLKKKQYLTHLEKTVKALSEENRKLKTAGTLKDTEIDQLKTEVKYLNNVIANQSTLSALLRNIHKTPGVHFADPPAETDTNTSENMGRKLNFNTNKRTGILKRKSTTEQESIQPGCWKTPRLTRSTSTIILKENELKNSMEDDSCVSKIESEVSGGICLHVTGQKVSLEFCAHCNHKSNSSFISSDHAYVRQQLR